MTTTFPELQNITSKKTLACISCSYLSPSFKTQGCPNCPFSPNEYLSWTTKNYKGIILIIDNKLSWVKRWQRLGVNGYYGLVIGNNRDGSVDKLHEEYIEVIEDSGREVIDRSKPFSL